MLRVGTGALCDFPGFQSLYSFQVCVCGLSSGSSAMLPWVWCVRHGRLCHLRPSEVDISGFPCTDWSPSGKQAGVFGPTFEVLLALIGWHRSVKTPVVLLENVPEFEVEVLRCLAGDLYDIQDFYIQPEILWSAVSEWSVDAPATHATQEYMRFCQSYLYRAR